MIDLKPFCSIEKWRHFISEPFSRGEFTYATNGHICIRIPRREDVPEREKAPDLGKVLNLVFALKDGEAPVDLSRLEELALAKRCEECKGSGFLVPCDDCNGGGEIECDACGHAQGCKQCGEKGHFPGSKNDDDAFLCEDCTGSGQRSSETYVAVADGLGFGTKYLRQIIALPNAKLYAGGVREIYEPHYFTFDGGDGVLMSVRLSGNEPKLYQKNEAAA